ncbi:MAG: hypothetical protein M3O09_14525, partial [Acidobacteriota bacterium]|nr:hypothetical protein [Acidobacteriota bacterium]
PEKRTKFPHSSVAVHSVVLRTTLIAFPGAKEKQHNALPEGLIGECPSSLFGFRNRDEKPTYIDKRSLKFGAFDGPGNVSVKRRLLRQRKTVTHSEAQ